MSAATFVALSGLETAPLENGAVLYHPETKKFIMLNRSAAMIWAELSSPKTRDELVRKICSAYPDVDAGVAHGDVDAALGELKALDLLSNGN